MRWSIRLGRLFGIGIYMHLTFLLLLLFVGYAVWTGTHSAEAVVINLSFILMLFAIVVLHELGHALAAKSFGIQTKDITLLPIGGVARLERIPREPVQELIIAIAGPAVNVVLAALFLLAGWVAFGTLPWADQAFFGGDVVSRLFWVNVMLVAFNLIPAFPMDGGRVLRALLAFGMDHARATRIAAAVGQTLALVFGFVGLFGIPGLLPPNFVLMFIALFVYLGATQEASLALTRLNLADTAVRRAMITRFETLTPHDSLGWVLQEVMAGGQKEFPVVDEGRVVGILGQNELMAGLHEHGVDGLVGSAMAPAPKPLTPDDVLADVMDRMLEQRELCLPVTEGERLVGLVTIENLREFLTAREMLRERPMTWPSVAGQSHAGMRDNAAAPFSERKETLA
ncbi:MAG: site-2 protease family protein [Gemmataceae bacterium]